MDLASKDLKRRVVKVTIGVVAGSLTLALLLLVVMVNSGLSIFAISGTSMEPTLHNRDSVILKQEKIPRQNQIAFFNKPSTWNYMGEEQSVLVKRIAAVEGDTLEFDGEAFKVNGEVIYPLSEDNYACENGEVGYKHRLNDTQVFVMGDNPLASLDSRRIFCDGHAEHIYIPKKDMVDFGHILKKF